MQDEPPHDGGQARAAGSILAAPSRSGLGNPTSQRMEAIGQFAGGIAHDFNNLLSVILTYSSFVRDALPAGEQARQDIEEVLDAARRATSLTQQLLAFSKGRPLQPRVLRLKPLILDMQRLLRRLIGEHIALFVRVEQPLWTVRMDASQLEQLLMNLAANARDAMPHGGELRIDVQNYLHDPGSPTGRFQTGPGEYVRIRVADTGHGMDAATQQRVFEPFFSTKGDGGTGLGLATCFAIVKQHEGAIHVRSTPGQGTVFEVLLPRSHRQRRASRVQTGEFELGSNQRILVVEDERPVRESVVRILGSSGYHVVQAGDGIEALEAFSARHAPDIDLVVTDVVMPRMSGPELIRRLRARAPLLPALFVTGHAPDARRRLGLLDTDTVMEKPIQPRRLLKRVQEALSAAA